MNKTITTIEFDRSLQKKLESMKASELLSIAGIYELVSEEFNNEIIEEWESSNGFMETEILLHAIVYNWQDGEQRELYDTDIEHIEKLIKDGFASGELYQYNAETDEEYRGWWEIDR